MNRFFYSLKNRIFIFFYKCFKKQYYLKNEEVLMFFNILHEYFKVYKNLMLALEYVVVTNKKFKFFQKVIGDLKKGCSFSKSVEELHVFDESVLSLIKMGENNSFLDCFSMIGILLKDRINKQKKMKKALFYPVFLLFMFCGVVLMFSNIIIPSLTEVFCSINDCFVRDIKYLIYFILLFKVFIYFIFLFGMSLMILYRLNNELFYKVLCCFSFSRKLVVEYYIILITAILSNCLNNNVDFNKALEILVKSIHLKFIRSYIQKVQQEVAQGKFINDVLDSNHVIPKLFVDIVRMGENTGNITKALLMANEVYQTRFENSMNNLLQYLPIVLTVMVSLFLIMFVYLLFLPVYSVGVVI